MSGKRSTPIRRSQPSSSRPYACWRRRGFSSLSTTGPLFSVPVATRRHGPRPSVRGGQGSAQSIGAALRPAKLGASARQTDWNQESYHGGGTQARSYPASDVGDRRYIPVVYSGPGRMTCSVSRSEEHTSELQSL